MGIPSLGGFFGARLTRKVVARLETVRTLWWAIRVVLVATAAVMCASALLLPRRELEAPPPSES